MNTKREELREFAQLVILLEHESKPVHKDWDSKVDPILFALKLQQYATRLYRYAETECNYGLTPEQNKRVESLEQKVKNLCAELGIKVTFNGDPRGYAVKLHFANEAHNTWGGKEEGWGI